MDLVMEFSLWICMGIVLFTESEDPYILLILEKLQHFLFNKFPFTHFLYFVL